jgi:hypothetical protein
MSTLIERLAAEPRERLICWLTRRMVDSEITIEALEHAFAKRGVAVLIVPVDVSHGEVKEDFPYRIHHSRPAVSQSDAEMEEIARTLNAGTRIAIHAGSGCEGALDEIMAVADRLKAPVAHTYDPGRPADQDCRVRQQQAGLCENRTEVGGHARHLHTPEESGRHHTFVQVQAADAVSREPAHIRCNPSVC